MDLACVLAQQPSVVLLDEPTTGIAQREAEALVSLLLEVRDKASCAMLVVEHDMGVISSACDRVVALDLGRVITSGAPVDVFTYHRVVEAYPGTSAGAIRRSGARSLS